jgi:hypothetical protein
MLNVGSVQNFEDLAHPSDNIWFAPVATAKKYEAWFDCLSCGKQTREIKVCGDNGASIPFGALDDLFVGRTIQPEC